MRSDAFHKISKLIFLICCLNIFTLSCQSKKSSSDNQQVVDPLATACSSEGKGTWDGKACICNAGWVIDPAGHCSIVDVSQSCKQSGGTMSGNTCHCPTTHSWDDSTHTCIQTTPPPSSTSTPTTNQTQCQAASATTGAFWNGNVCLCQNVSYPYWDATNLRCTATIQNSTSPVGSATQAQCTAASAMGAYWNNQACQCTSPSYPYWDPVNHTCSATIASSNPPSNSGACAQNELLLLQKCTKVTMISEKAGCIATAGDWRFFLGCSCPSGTEWYKPLKSCQSNADVTAYAPRLCVLTGGQLSTVDATQCLCPSGLRSLQDGVTRGQYCAD